MEQNKITLLQEANQLFRAKQYVAALSLYRKLLASTGLPATVVEFNIRLCESRLATKALGASVATAVIPDADATSNVKAVSALNLDRCQTDAFGVAKPDSYQPVSVTLTTIKSRLPRIKPVLESLHTQTVKPVEIILNISHDAYLLDEGIEESDSYIRELRELSLVRINWVENIGPYRKIWFFLEEHFQDDATEEKLFITVDDDTLYPDYFIEKLLKEHKQHDCIVAFRGRHIEVDQACIAPYNKWTNGQPYPSLSNLPTGKDGILYSTRFFTKHFLGRADALRLAPTADDLWIKWHCALNGVRSIILNPEACLSDYKSFPVVDYSPEYRGNSLYASHNSAQAGGKNDVAVSDLEEYYLSRYGYNLMTLISQNLAEAA
jgi:hypothetical protein